MGTTTWSPLASGLLTGKYINGIPKDARLSLLNYEWLRNRLLGDEGKDKIEKVKKLEPLAKELKITLPVLAIAWCLKNNNVSSVITGASRPEQVKQNMQGLEVINKLTTEVLERIEQILGNKPRPEYDFR